MATEKPRLDVTFATKTSKKDWPRFLAGAFERKSNFYPFARKVLYLNNEVPQVDWPYETYDVIEHMDEILDFFELKNHDFEGGLWYSIAELAAIYNCKTEYLCYVQSDCRTEGDWVTPGIKLLDEYSTVAPYSEVNTWGDDWHFSDQAFLIRTEEYRKPIYHKTNVPDYPKYGGQYFERMCGAYLKKNKLKRKVLNDYFCHHQVW